MATLKGSGRIEPVAIGRIGGAGVSAIDMGPRPAGFRLSGLGPG
jgi:hypothetical protein